MIGNLGVGRLQSEEVLKTDRRKFVKPEKRRNKGGGTAMKGLRKH